jgi:cytidylate kinase
MQPIDLANIRIITVSGRIASGSTTLAHNLSKTLGWRHIEGGKIFWEAVRSKMGVSEKDTNLRPDTEDEDFDRSLKHMLKTGKHLILETKLAGFNAQGENSVFKILVLCKDADGNDQTQIRIDRLVNREHLAITSAKEEVIEREKNDIEKWRRLYAPNDPDWTYWDEKYYNLVVNTYPHDKEETLRLVLQKLGYENNK